MGIFHQRNTKAAKMTLGKVEELRRLYATGEYSQGDLARHFGISGVQVGRIVRGESWGGPRVPTPAEIGESERKMRALVGIEQAATSTGEEGRQGTSLLERLAADVSAKQAEEGKGEEMLMELQSLHPDLPVSEEVEKRKKAFLGEE